VYSHRSLQVLILLTEFRNAQQVTNFCETHNLRYWLAENLIQVQALLVEHSFDLIFLDLNLPDLSWQRLVRTIQEHHPQAQIIGVVEPSYPLSEAQLYQAGIHLILSKPLTAERIEQMLFRASSSPAQTPGLSRFSLAPSKLRFPVRFKIVLPYLLLSAIVMIIGLLLMSRIVVDTMEERFQRQLVDAGIMAADHMVKEEQALLATWRAVAFTAQAPQWLAQGDAEALRALILPTVINDGVDAVDFIALDQQETLLSLRQSEQPAIYTALTGVSFADVSFVQDALARYTQGEYKRYAGLFREQAHDFLYVVGPVVDEQQSLVGILLVGTEITRLASTMKEGVLANISFYDQRGNILDSTLASVAMPPPLAAEQVAAIVHYGDQSSLVRPITAGSSDYHEVLGVWRSSRGDQLGFYGAALTRALLVQIAGNYRLQLALWVVLACLVVTILGLYLANRMTVPLLQLIRASRAVAGGNLTTQVDVKGSDEIGLLTASFNQMVQQLRESVIYRDLLGRAVSAPVRDQLRQAFQAGELRLSGQNVMTTVLISDIRNFTAISEQADSTTVLRWLNEYFSELVPVVGGNNGVLSSFAGDSLVAFFGVLPKPVCQAEGAYQACLAATQMCSLIERLNERRAQRGDPPLITGIALHSGLATAGGLGSAERVQYTIVGDTVNAASRLGEFAKGFTENTILISRQTVEALGPRSTDFVIEPMGQYAIRGKTAAMGVCRLRSSDLAPEIDALDLHWSLVQ
jgi:adenylate cyclase